MKEWVDYYSIMQVHQHAEYDVIENTYKKLCRKYHPDINDDPSAGKKMAMINIAYSVLRDEKKRNQYYQEWLRHYNTPLKPSAAQAFRTSQPFRPSDNSNDEARKVVMHYFECLSAGLYDDAYNVLSRLDKQNISPQQFRLWQQRVGSIYKIHQFYVQNYKQYDQFKLRNQNTCPAKRFMMSLNEEIIQTRTRTMYSLYKFVIFEDNEWRVYLGYTDVVSLAQKFASSKVSEKNHDDEIKRLTAKIKGIIEKPMFLHQAEVESNRYKRYKRNFVIGVMQLRTDNNVNSILDEQITVFTGRAFISRLRKMDALCYLGNRRFCILMAETTLSEASGVCDRILKKIYGDIYIKFHINLLARTELREYGSGSASQLLESCVAAIEAQSYKK